MLTRIVTAVLAGSITLAAILWREPWGLAALLVCVLILTTIEAARLADRLGLVLALAVVVLTAYVLWVDERDQPVLSEGMTLAWLFGLLVWLPNNFRPVLFLSGWIVSGTLSTLFLYIQSNQSVTFGPSLVLVVLLPLWVGDSLAYFVGKAIGRHKLAPSISPNKTWEGAIANLLGCLAAAWGIGIWLRLPIAASIAVGLTTGVLGQVGDLLQSRIKRLANVKDSGSILPGHGGVLDRLDSFLFSAYPSLVALWFLAPEAFHVKQWPW